MPGVAKKQNMSVRIAGTSVKVQNLPQCYFVHHNLLLPMLELKVLPAYGMASGVLYHLFY
jgi:hypothetical protein